MYFMGPDCNRVRNLTLEDYSTQERVYQRYQKHYYDLANWRGFTGGDTNR